MILTTTFFSVSNSLLTMKDATKLDIIPIKVTSKSLTKINPSKIIVVSIKRYGTDALMPVYF